MRTTTAADDGGSLLLLAGFILGLALVVTGLTISEVAELEKAAIREQDTSFTTEYRALRTKFGHALADSVTPTTNYATLAEGYTNVFANFDELANARGYQLVSTLAGSMACTAVTAPADKSECVTLTTADALNCPSTGRRYASTGDSYFDGATVRCYDGTDDGVLNVGTVMKAAYVYLHLSDSKTRIDEVVLYPLNR